MKHCFLYALCFTAVTTGYADEQLPQNTAQTPDPTVQECTYLGNDLAMHPGTQHLDNGQWTPCEATEAPPSQ